MPKQNIGSPRIEHQNHMRKKTTGFNLNLEEDQSKKIK
jgi:hypothetical protein